MSFDFTLVSRNLASNIVPSGDRNRLPKANESHPLNEIPLDEETKDCQKALIEYLENMRRIRGEMQRGMPDKSKVQDWINQTRNHLNTLNTKKCHQYIGDFFPHLVLDVVGARNELDSAEDRINSNAWSDAWQFVKQLFEGLIRGAEQIGRQLDRMPALPTIPGLSPMRD